MKLQFDNLKREFNENPTAVLAVMGLAASGFAKLLKVVVDGRNSRTWNKEVNRRVKNTKR